MKLICAHPDFTESIDIVLAEFYNIGSKCFPYMNCGNRGQTKQNITACLVIKYTSSRKLRPLLNKRAVSDNTHFLDIFFS